MISTPDTNTLFTTAESLTSNDADLLLKWIVCSDRDSRVTMEEQIRKTPLVQQVLNQLELGGYNIDNFRLDLLDSLFDLPISIIVLNTITTETFIMPISNTPAESILSIIADNIDLEPYQIARKIVLELTELGYFDEGTLIQTLTAFWNDWGIQDRNEYPSEIRPIQDTLLDHLVKTYIAPSFEIGLYIQRKAQDELARIKNRIPVMDLVRIGLDEIDCIVKLRNPRDIEEAIASERLTSRFIRRVHEDFSS